LVRKSNSKKGSQCQYINRNFPTKDEHWDSGLEITNECPDLQTEVNIILDTKVYSIITALLQEFSTTEFLVYLDGEVKTVENSIEMYLNKILIPKQEVSYASVDVLEPIPSLAVLHKHPGGSSFSHIDDEFINSNHMASIVVDGSNMAAVCRVKARCGRYLKVDANVSIGASSDTKQFIDEAKEKIKEKVYKYQKWNWRGGFRKNYNIKATYSCVKINNVQVLRVENVISKPIEINLTESDVLIRNLLDGELSDDFPYHYQRENILDEIMGKVKLYKKMFGIKDYAE